MENATFAPNNNISEYLKPLSKEEREKKRAELDERIKAAAAKNTDPPAVKEFVSNTLPDTSEIKSDQIESETANSAAKPREDMVRQAVSFLTSEKVRNASWEKKAEFLLGKGLTEAEIAMAKDEADKRPIVNV